MLNVQTFIYHGDISAIYVSHGIVVWCVLTSATLFMLTVRFYLVLIGKINSQVDAGQIVN